MYSSYYSAHKSYQIWLQSKSINLWNTIEHLRQKIISKINLFKKDIDFKNTGGAAGRRETARKNTNDDPRNKQIQQEQLPIEAIQEKTVNFEVILGIT